MNLFFNYKDSESTRPKANELERLKKLLIAKDRIISDLENKLNTLDPEYKMTLDDKEFNNLPIDKKYASIEKLISEIEKSVNIGLFEEDLVFDIQTYEYDPINKKDNISEFINLISKYANYLKSIFDINADSDSEPEPEKSEIATELELKQEEKNLSYYHDFFLNLSKNDIINFNRKTKPLTKKQENFLFLRSYASYYKTLNNSKQKVINFVQKYNSYNRLLYDFGENIKEIEYIKPELNLDNKNVEKYFSLHNEIKTKFNGIKNNINSLNEYCSDIIKINNDEFSHDFDIYNLLKNFKSQLDKNIDIINNCAISGLTKFSHKISDIPELQKLKKTIDEILKNQNGKSGEYFWIWRFSEKNLSTIFKKLGYSGDASINIIKAIHWLNKDTNLQSIIKNWNNNNNLYSNLTNIGLYGIGGISLIGALFFGYKLINKGGGYFNDHKNNDNYEKFIINYKKNRVKNLKDVIHYLKKQNIDTTDYNNYLQNYIFYLC